jgi:hypothetical protein
VETIATLVEHTLKRFHRLLSNSIQGNNIITGDFIAGSAYSEMFKGTQA